MNDSLAEKIIAIIASVKRLPVERVSLESSFEELGLDSLDAMNILFELEQEFSISIPDQQARAIRTVRDAVEGVRMLLPAGA